MGVVQLKLLSSLGKSHSILVFELKCFVIASTVKIFWDIVNVTIGFNIQESSSSNLGMFYRIVPRTAIEF